MNGHYDTRFLREKYRVTGYLYDLLDAPWERIYRRLRPEILSGMSGRILEAGFGTGRNAEHYPAGVEVVAFDLSESMLRFGKRRARVSSAAPRLLQADALRLPFPPNTFDFYIATFLYCVLPDALQPRALREMIRVLKPGGRFRLLEILYSKTLRIRLRQKFFAPFVKTVYGARFDRKTTAFLDEISQVQVLSHRFLHKDTLLLIEGCVLE
ncbi:MAG: class I SAM-dependent methyltransferase [Candidatus Hydrogenedentota bacterium]|nr:MAG: class I SAM-dependent methyltransferase [Candidatus Hydrogenedentota bacterium]